MQLQIITAIGTFCWLDDTTLRAGTKKERTDGNHETHIGQPPIRSSDAVRGPERLGPTSGHSDEYALLGHRFTEHSP